MNKYIYVGNNPALNNDPSGEWFFVALLVGALIGGVDAALNDKDFLAGAFKGAIAGMLIYFTWNVSASSTWFGILSAPQKWAGFILAMSGAVVGAASSGGSFADNLINRTMRGHTAIGAAATHLEYAIEVNMVRVPWSSIAERIAYPIMITFGYVLAQIPKLTLEEDFRK